MKFIYRLIPRLSRQEVQIEAAKRAFHKAIDEDILRVKRANAKLDNDPELRLYRVASNN